MSLSESLSHRINSEVKVVSVVTLSAIYTEGTLMTNFTGK